MRHEAERLRNNGALQVCAARRPSVPLIRDPAPAQRVHEIDREREILLAISHERELRVVQRALRVEHFEVSRIP